MRQTAPGFLAIPIALALAVAVAACGVLAPTAPAPRHLHPVAAAPAADTRSVAVYWIGHATVLVRLGDRWILTDPVFADRLGGVVVRKVGAALSIDELPPLDCVLVSHGHLDHLERPTLARLDRRATLVVPPGLPSFVPPDHFAALATLAPWQSIDCHGVRITAVPASHGNGRYGLDALWRRHDHTGFVLEGGGVTGYFAGDTGYDPSIFRAIGARFAIDLALLPVGPAGRARWIERWRRDVHLTPADALLAFAETGARWMVPVHWGAFYQDPRDERRVIEAAIAADPRRDRVRLLTVGDSAEFLW